jgi:uncharacterized protein YdaL
MTTQQDYHQACKKRFNTMLFQLFGNKALVKMFVRIPVCIAAQPAAVLKTFAQDWQTFQHTPIASKAVQAVQHRTGRSALLH